MHMIYGIGTDIVAIDRIKNLYRTYNLRFINRILSRGEIDILPRNNGHIFIAGRFAAKESLFKAMGSRGSLGFSDIEILNDHAGRPFMRDNARVRENIQSLKDTDSLRIHISISHERAYAIALVVIEIVQIQIPGT
jgi:holo-[acyl-carrier protein] synthase